jgi:hypothetical protein
MAPPAQAPDAVGACCSAGVDPEHLFQVASPDNQQPVQALGPHRRDPPLRERVRVGRLDRGAQHRGALRPEHLVEAATELRVTVAEQKPYPSALFSEHDHEVAGLLGDPGAVGVGGHSDQVDDAGVVFDEEQYVQPS